MEIKNTKISNGVKFILGKKIEMSQIFDEKGNVIPVTLVKAGPCYITQIKTKEKDKYESVQIGFEKIEDKKVKKPQKDRPYRYLREFKTHPIIRSGARSNDRAKYKVKDKIDVSVFQEGDIVKVSGISKGKGFAGGVKKWGFHGKSATHGTKHEERTIGSIGSAFPQRVIKGKKMPGRMGTERITVKNLKIVKVDIENNIIMIKGAIPGRRGTLLEIRA